LQLNFIFTVYIFIVFAIFAFPIFCRCFRLC
jgi:hypothetical protein